MDERLELGRQDHVHQDEGQGEGEGQVLERAAHLFVLAPYLPAHIGALGDPPQGVLDLHDGLVQPPLHHVGVYGDDPGLVLPVDLRRAQSLTDPDEFPDGHALHPKPLQRRHGVPQLLGVPHHHVDLPVEVDELGGPVPAHGPVHRPRHRHRVDAVGGARRPVDLHLHLGLTPLRADPDIPHDAPPFQAAFHLHGHGVGLVQVLGTDPHRDVRLGAAQEGTQCRGLPGLHRQGAGGELVGKGPEAVSNPLRPLVAPHPHLEGGGVEPRRLFPLGVGPHVPTDVTEDRRYARVGQRRLLDAGRRLRRCLQGGSLGELQADLEGPLVHLGQEVTLQQPSHHHRQNQGRAGAPQHPGRVVQRPLQGGMVPPGEDLEPGVEAPEHGTGHAAQGGAGLPAPEPHQGLDHRHHEAHGDQRKAHHRPHPPEHRPHQARATGPARRRQRPHRRRAHQGETRCHGREQCKRHHQ